jgi:hypothetical protein
MGHSNPSSSSELTPITLLGIAISEPIDTDITDVTTHDELSVYLSHA